MEKVMEFKGTKGKWYHSKGTLSIWHPKEVGKRIICVDSDYLRPTKEQIANALLCSKAPELLDALQEIVCAFENNALKDVTFAKKLIQSATEI